MSSSSDRAMRMRWSWPPLSWCGYLPRSDRCCSSRQRGTRRPCLPVSAVDLRKEGASHHAEDVIDLEHGIYRAERILEDALHLPVIRVEPRPENVPMSGPSIEIRPPLISIRRRIILPIVVLPLPLSPMRETTSPLARSKLTSLTARSVDPPNVPKPVDLRDLVESQHSVRPPSSTRRDERARSPRTAAPRHISRRPGGSAPGTGNRSADPAAPADSRGCP